MGNAKILVMLALLLVALTTCCAFQVDLAGLRTFDRNSRRCLSSSWTMSASEARTSSVIWPDRVVEAAKEKAAELGIDGKGTTKRHILLCCDQTKPKCCKKEIADQSWEYLKRRLKETNLVGSGGVFRTKANCLQVCMAGPVAVVYPEGVWYHSCNESVHRTEHTNKSFFEAVHVIGLVNLLRR
jgi:hypothetical protein